MKNGAPAISLAPRKGAYMIDPTMLLAGERGAAAVPVIDGNALCLSGGGFRATLFCLGSLWRLNEFGALPKLKLVTSVSGGSIVSGLLGLRWAQLRFDSNGVASNFAELIAKPIQAFCAERIAVPAAVGGLLNPFKSIGDEMTEAYEELYAQATLQDLPDEGTGPEFLLYATSLQTGRSVRMTRAAVVDYLIGALPKPEISLARAVAASSAFPPVLSPQVIKIEHPEIWQPTKYSDPSLSGPEWRQSLVLTDGGTYDNMGLEAAWHRYKTVLVCDAGAPFKYDVSPHEDWLRQSVRIMDVMTDQCRSLRKRWLIQDYKDGVRRGTYWGIRTRVSEYGDTGLELCAGDSQLSASLAGIRTNLDPFSPEEQGHLINWGYALADAGIRRWVTDLGSAKGQQPIAEFPV